MGEEEEDAPTGSCDDRCGNNGDADGEMSLLYKRRPTLQAGTAPSKRSSIGGILDLEQDSVNGLDLLQYSSPSVSAPFSCHSTSASLSVSTCLSRGDEE